MNLKIETGRSMVEMLGTLAIVGVLSIGGVMGYKYGMDKYHANETINELTVRALDLMPQVERGEIVELKMAMGDKTKLGYTVDAWIDEQDPKYFYIGLDGVPSDICRQILKQNLSMVTNIYVGDSNVEYGHWVNICGKTTAAQMDFEFYLDFEKVKDINYVEGTATYYETPYLNKCSDPTPLQDIYGNCHSCDTTAPVDVRNGKCEVICPNRLIGSGGVCYFPETHPRN